jgi:hypothetical protein
VFTWLSDPLMLRLVVPDPLTLAPLSPLTDNLPWLSLNVTVNVSSLVLPDGVRLGNRVFVGPNASFTNDHRGGKSGASRRVRGVQRRSTIVTAPCLLILAPA